jgi:uncharacterized phage protein gp47/JayE
MYTPPTVSQILNDLRQSVKAELPATDPWITYNNLVPFLKAIAQGLRAAYLRLGFIHQQAFVSSARGEYLDYHGIQTGGLARDPAQYAQGIVVATGILGSVIPDGTLLARSDGIMFSTIGTVTLITTTANLYTKANEAGELGNTDDSTVLSPQVTVPGVSSFIVDADGLIGGKEEESDDSFRQRILFLKQNPPHGGSPTEYFQWCQTKSGVTRVFVQRATPGPGSVTVYFMMDGIGTGIPNTADVMDLQGILDQLAPADANVIAAAPSTQVVNVTVTGLVPDSADIRNKVVDELKDMFVRRGEPASVISSFTFAKAWLDEAISMVPKWRRHVVTVPAADVVVTTPGAIPVLGTVTFA